jgi:DNA-binding response OmpR family regulator
MDPIRLAVLLVEDNAALSANVYDYLEACGHRPDAAPDGRVAAQLLESTRYDAVVLDWMMPRMDGISLLGHLRETLRSDVPVILLTARDQLEHRLLGLESGADDYLVKPVALAELELRLRIVAARRRVPAAEPGGRVLRVDDLVFDLDTSVVTRAGEPLAMSPIRRRLLHTLMRASPRTVSRTELEEQIWGDAPPDGDILRSHLHLLRKAVDGGRVVRLLHTVPGVGYRLAAGHGP